MKGRMGRDGDRLTWSFDGERVAIEPWGRDSLRVRAGHLGEPATEDWALLLPEPLEPTIAIGPAGASIRNGQIEARITADGRIEFLDAITGRRLLREYVRRRDTDDAPRSALKISARHFRGLVGGDHELTVRFESDPTERIFGMGQYQHAFLDQKGCTLELAHRNSQASVPFALSSLGYGFLWNNPAIGHVTFGKNVTEWGAASTRQMDYWITVGDRPADIVEAYGRATGTAPVMPDWATGLWQSRLRYRSQDELLGVAREYRRRGMTLSAIVADFFHWRMQGDWAFDPDAWPDPTAMVTELREMGTELVVSFWPTVDKAGERYPEMLRDGLLVRAERGMRTTMEFGGSTVYVDFTDPDARSYVWGAIEATYWRQGVRAFFLDEAEPEYPAYDFDHYRYRQGPVLRIGNVYPVTYAKAFYDGMTGTGAKNVVNVIRSAWAGSQRYGALVWSGDTDTSWAAFRQQLRAGLNMGLAGIPWWTSDTGGFHGGAGDEPGFRELLTRWFQFSTFCPVLRMHGDREPQGAPPGSRTTPTTGGPNEVWSFGEETYGILRRYFYIRERLRPYIGGLMRAAHERGTPLMRPLFYDFPDDAESWSIDDQYMFGPNLMVAPVLEPRCETRSVYLPEGRWFDAWTGTSHEGGVSLEAASPIDRIPIYTRTFEMVDLVAGDATPAFGGYHSVDDRVPQIEAGTRPDRGPAD